MQKITADSPEANSANLVAENIARLKEFFPEAFTEDGIDFEVLKQLLGGAVNEKEEKYSFTWPGKRQAIQIALTPSLGTLRPAHEESVDWGNTQNLFIEGDNLEVLKLLQKSYSGKVKMIYIDPPYNTGNDFVYPDDYHDNIKNYLSITEQADQEGKHVTSNPETSGRYHSNWLNMMYPRLRLARNLLQDTGVIFISIDDNESYNLIKLCNEIFGEENLVSHVTWQRKYSVSNNATGIAPVKESIVIYSKTDAFRIGLLERSDESSKRYSNPDNDPRGPWKAVDFWNQASPEARPNLSYKIINPHTGVVITPTKKAWKSSKDVFERYIAEKRVWWGVDGTNSVPAIKLFLNEVRNGMVPSNLWLHKDVGHTDEAKKEINQLFGVAPFDTPKPLRLLRRIMVVADIQDHDIILDFFAGSATTAHAVLDLNKHDHGNRRFIMVQLPEPIEDPKLSTISEVGKERIRRVIAKIKAEHPDYIGDLGFRVFKLDSSNIRPWTPDAANIASSLLSYADNLLPDRTEQDLLYEVLLKFGLDLTAPMQEKNFTGHTVYSLGQGVLFACLSKTIASADVESIGLGIANWRKETLPVGESTVIFRDSAFAGDVAKANMTAILQQHGIDNVRSV